MSSSSPSKARKGAAKKAVLSTVQSVVDKTMATMARQPQKKKNKKNKNKNKNKNGGGTFTSTVDRRDFPTIVHLNDSWGELVTPVDPAGLHCLAIGNINPSLPYVPVATNFLEIDFKTQGSSMANNFGSGFLTRSVAQANPFDQWVGDDINISYNHRAGEFSNAGKTGEIVIAYQPNSNEGLPLSTTDLDNMKWRVATIPCKDCVLRLPASLFKRRRYTRTGVIPATAAIDDYDAGRIIVYGYGFSADAISEMLGEIKITGSLKMFEATMASQQTSQQVPAPRNVVAFGIPASTLNAAISTQSMNLVPIINTNMISAGYLDDEPIKVGSAAAAYNMPPGYFRVTQSCFNLLSTTGIGDATVYTTFNPSINNGIFTLSNQLTNTGAVSQTVGGCRTAQHLFYAASKWNFNVIMTKTLTGLATSSYANAFQNSTYAQIIEIEAL